jgi:hypothetical protein
MTLFSGAVSDARAGLQGIAIEFNQDSLPSHLSSLANTKFITGVRIGVNDERNVQKAVIYGLSTIISPDRARSGLAKGSAG